MSRKSSAPVTVVVSDPAIEAIRRVLQNEKGPPDAADARGFATLLGNVPVRKDSLAEAQKELLIAVFDYGFEGTTGDQESELFEGLDKGLAVLDALMRERK